MRVLLSISERDYLIYRRARSAQKSKASPLQLEMVLADGTTFPHKGRIIIADRAVDLKTGTLGLVAEFPNPEGILRPGQFGRVRLAVSTAEDAILVPQQAVTELQSAKVVYVVGPENKVQLRSVTLGNRSGGDYIVTDGLKAGERIIVEGVLKARPGITVQPTETPVSVETSAPKKGA
jgi:membrane fusion protein (multidrug efflux system)